MSYVICIGGFLRWSQNRSCLGVDVDLPHTGGGGGQIAAYSMGNEERIQLRLSLVRGIKNEQSAACVVLDVVHVLFFLGQIESAFGDVESPEARCLRMFGSEVCMGALHADYVKEQPLASAFIPYPLISISNCN